MLARRMLLGRRNRPNSPISSNELEYAQARGVPFKVSLDVDGYVRITQSAGSNVYSSYTGFVSPDVSGFNFYNSSLRSFVRKYSTAAINPDDLSNYLSQVDIANGPSVRQGAVLRNRTLSFIVTTTPVLTQWDASGNLLGNTTMTGYPGSARFIANGGQHALLSKTSATRETGTDSEEPTLIFDGAYTFVDAPVSAATPELLSVIASVDGSISTRWLPDDSRLAIPVPPGADSLPVWHRKITATYGGGITCRDEAYFVASMSFTEIRRGADGESVGTIKRGYLSWCAGNIVSLFRMDNAGTISLVNVLSRNIRYFPLAFYAVSVRSAGGFFLHFNTYTNGVAEADFPRQTIVDHPQNVIPSGFATSQALSMRRLGDYMLIPSTIAGKILRIRIGEDSQSSLSIIDTPSGFSYLQTFEKQGIIYTRNASDTAAWQSKDFGATWATFSGAAGGDRYTASQELIPL